MSGFKLAPLSLIVGSLFVVSAVQAQDFTLDGSSADVTQNVTAEDKITSLNVSGGHTGTITGETITISGTGNVANVTTAGHPTATVSTLTIGTDQTKKVSITTDKDWALYNNGSSLTVLGEEIHLERTSADGANYGEAFRTTGYGTTKVGNEKTKLVSIKSKGDCIALLPYGGKSQTNGSVTVTAEEIRLEAGANGIWAQNNSTGIEGAYAPVVLNATKGIHITAGSSALVAMSQGRIELNGNTYIKGENAILTRGESIVTINKSRKDIVQMEGDINFNYDKPTSGTGVDADVNINLSGADSYWVGNTKVTWGQGKPDDLAKLEVHDLTLSLSDGAQWTPTKIVENDVVNNGTIYTNMNNLVLNGGAVNVTSPDVQVTVDNLTGDGGAVNLATDLTAEEGQQAGTITVTKADENTDLTVKLKNADMTKDLTADDVTPEQAAALNKNVQGDVKSTVKVDEGMYNGAFDVTDAGSTISRGPNSVMQSTLELAAAAPLALNRILVNDVHKRMGDIRSMKTTSGVWARYDGGKLSGDADLENDFHTIQVGVDTMPTADAPRFGVALAYTMGDAEYARGEADMDAFSLAAYGLWMGEAGQFVDVVARLGKASTDMTVDGSKKGSMDNIVTALSGEFGWRFDLTKSFYLEPQVELAYTHVDADDLVLSDGSNYRFDDADSLMGRAGFALGFQCPETGNSAYVRVSAVHEFMGDAGVTGGNGTVYEIDGKDTWVEYGLGANFILTNSTYLWADVERTSGGYLDEDWRATVGVRYNF